MENQIDIKDQNSQQAGESLSNQPMLLQGKQKINYWMILSLILGFLLLVMVGVNLIILKTTKNKNSSIIPSSQISISPVITKSTIITNPISNISRFEGTLKTGAQLEDKSYCPNGLYLVAGKGSYLVDQIKVLQLRLPDEPNKTKIISDQNYIGKRVDVTGKYSVQKKFCEALTCECEDYILVETLNIVDEQGLEGRLTKIEGQIECLPRRDKIGPQTLECAIGLKDKNKKYYILEGLEEQDLISGKIKEGQKVIITGILRLGQDSEFDTIGTLKIVSVVYTK